MVWQKTKGKIADWKFKSALETENVQVVSKRGSRYTLLMLGHVALGMRFRRELQQLETPDHQTVAHNQ
jgi:hypothetical protein